MVGTVLSTSPMWSLYKMVVFPAASRPSMTTFTGEKKKKYWSGSECGFVSKQVGLEWSFGKKKKKKQGVLGGPRFVVGREGGPHASP